MRCCILNTSLAKKSRKESVWRSTVRTQELTKSRDRAAHEDEDVRDTPHDHSACVISIRRCCFLLICSNSSKKPKSENKQNNPKETGGAQEGLSSTNVHSVADQTTVGVTCTWQNARWEQYPETIRYEPTEEQSDTGRKTNLRLSLVLQWHLFRSVWKFNLIQSLTNWPLKSRLDRRNVSRLPIFTRQAEKQALETRAIHSKSSVDVWGVEVQWWKLHVAEVRQSQKLLKSEKTRERVTRPKVQSSPKTLTLWIHLDPGRQRTRKEQCTEWRWELKTSCWCGKEGKGQKPQVWNVRNHKNSIEKHLQRIPTKLHKNCQHAMTVIYG